MSTNYCSTVTGDDGNISGFGPRNYSKFVILPANGVIISDDVACYLTSQWLTVFVPSVYTVMFIVSLSLNVMAIIMFLFKIKLKKPAVVYVLNLAASDVLFITLLPFNIAYRFSGNNWLMDGTCRFFTAAFYCNTYCSILLMTSMSVDRLLAVVYPMETLSWRTVRQAWLVCLFIWVISITSTVPLLTRKQAQYILTLYITTCHDVLEVSHKSFSVYYFTTLILALFFLPLIITTVCYIGTIRSLSSSNMGIAFIKNWAVFLTAIVLCMYVLCFGPTNVLFIIHYVYSNRVSFFYYVGCTCVSSISCCLDPLIYYYASSQCQRNGQVEVKQRSTKVPKKECTGLARLNHVNIQ